MVARDEWHAQVLIGQSGLGTTEDMELFKEKVCCATLASCGSVGSDTMYASSGRGSTGRYRARLTARGHRRSMEEIPGTGESGPKGTEASTVRG